MKNIVLLIVALLLLFVLPTVGMVISASTVVLVLLSPLIAFSYCLCRFIKVDQHLNIAYSDRP